MAPALTLPLPCPLYLPLSLFERLGESSELIDIIVLPQVLFCSNPERNLKTQRRLARALLPALVLANPDMGGFSWALLALFNLHSPHSIRISSRFDPPPASRSLFTTMHRSCDGERVWYFTFEPRDRTNSIYPLTVSAHQYHTNSSGKATQPTSSPRRIELSTKSKIIRLLTVWLAAIFIC